jgi:hypothetical protein
MPSPIQSDLEAVSDGSDDALEKFWNYRLAMAREYSLALILAC